MNEILSVSNPLRTRSVMTRAIVGIFETLIAKKKATNRYFAQRVFYHRLPKKGSKIYIIYIYIIIHYYTLASLRVKNADRFSENPRWSPLPTKPQMSGPLSSRYNHVISACHNVHHAHTNRQLLYFSNIDL